LNGGVKTVVKILVGENERKLFERNLYMWCYTNHTQTVYDSVDYNSEFRRGPNDSINGEETLANLGGHFLNKDFVLKI